MLLSLGIRAARQCGPCPFVSMLVTLNPIGAQIAHAGLHTSAVLHSYETDTFLPPHR